MTLFLLTRAGKTRLMVFVPGTSDGNMIALWLSILLISIFGMARVVWARRQ